MTDAPADVTRRRRISAIWVVPIVALLLGLWMVVYTYRNQGPEITVVFSTAEGIEAGKTRIKARSVEVGLVDSVVLGPDLESVVVTARLEPSAAPLLREDTELWVVRARVGTGGISGLGTIVSGGYIQLDPGTGPEGRRDFVGLDDAPVTPVGTPGLKLTLVSSRAGSLGTGDPILFKSFRVGRVESAEFDVDSQEARYGAFIEAPYDSLVSDATRFWNTSGLSFSATPDGIELNTGSLESLLFGGVSFGLPKGADPGAPVENGADFDLYPDYDSVNERPYRHSLEYVVQFARSVRGLRPGAPVEYRGLRAGTVERVMLKELVAEGAEGEGSPIPVLIRLDPGRLEMGDTQASVAALGRSIEAAVRNGLRATLATGSLLTGSLFVALDMYPEEAPAQTGSFAGRATIPTIASGLEGIEQKVTALLDKLNAMPLENVIASADDTIQQLEASLAALTDVLNSVSPDSILHERLIRAITDLDRTLQSVEALATAIEEQPNSLIFSRRSETDPEPPAGAP